MSLGKTAFYLIYFFWKVSMVCFVARLIELPDLLAFAALGGR